MEGLRIRGRYLPHVRRENTGITFTIVPRHRCHRALVGTRHARPLAAPLPLDSLLSCSVPSTRSSIPFEVSPLTDRSFFPLRRLLGPQLSSCTSGSHKTSAMAQLRWIPTTTRPSSIIQAAVFVIVSLLHAVTQFQIIEWVF